MVELYGLPQLEDEDEDFDIVVEKAIDGVIRSMPAKKRGAIEVLGEAVRRAVRSEVNQFWGKKPIVKVFVHKV